jgi:hypothetical protein
MHPDDEGRVLGDPGELDLPWLEGALTRSGALARGGVEAVEVEGGEGSWSRHARLRVRYAPGSAGALPPTLFLKLCEGEQFGPSEVRYYGRDYAGLRDGPVVRCHDAAYRHAPRAYHLLLDDVSATHADTWEREVTPTLAHGVAEALAALHAHRWGAARLAEVGERPAGRAELERYVRHVRAGLDPLLAIAGDALDAEARAALPALFEQHPPRMLARAGEGDDQCLVHGDVNPGNVLAPREDGAGRVLLVDRQPFAWSLTTWLGASDLAYLMCTFWPVAARRAHEDRVLRAYHAALAARGVRGYGLERLREDYRLCVPQSAYVAVEWCVQEEDRERMRWLWTVQLERALTAMADLGLGGLAPRP